MEKLVERRSRTGSPFHTTDAILAFSLYLVGVPFYEERKPCINMYDEGILKRLGFTGGTIEEGVRKALARKKKGHVEYGFQRTAGADSMTLVRLCCVILKMRVKFVNLWQDLDPLIRVWNDGEVEDSRDEDGVLTRRRFPGFRIVSLNARQETKEKLKL